MDHHALFFPKSRDGRDERPSCLQGPEEYVWSSRIRRRNGRPASASDGPGVPVEGRPGLPRLVGWVASLFRLSSLSLSSPTFPWPCLPTLLAPLLVLATSPLQLDPSIHPPIIPSKFATDIAAPRTTSALPTLRLTHIYARACLPCPSLPACPRAPLLAPSPTPPPYPRAGARLVAHRPPRALPLRRNRNIQAPAPRDSAPSAGPRGRRPGFLFICIIKPLPL